MPPTAPSPSTSAFVGLPPGATTDAKKDGDSNVRDLLEKLVAAIAAQADAAVRKARAEAHAELEKIRALTDDLQSDLQAERDATNTVRAQLSKESNARASAEAALEEALRVRDREAADFDSRLKAVQRELELERDKVGGLEQQLEAARSEATTLLAAVQAVQRAVSSPQTGPEPRDRNQGNVRESKGGDRQSEAKTDREDLQTKTTSTSAVGGAAADESDADEADAFAEANGELVTYIKQLLEDVEAMYQADRESARTSAEATDRLTANLRYAREIFLRRAGSEKEALFKRQLMLLLDAKWEGDFGRHLTFSAYDLYPRSRESSSAA